MALTLEKKVLSEIIQLYKEHTCLWNPTHKMYTNKLARERAYNVLLEKYKLFDSLANKHRVKKKIENMRTTYKRERAKVLKSQINGDDLYEPTLWYYEDMKFLDDVHENRGSQSRNISITNTADDDATEEGSQSPQAKRPASVYLTDEENDYIIATNKSHSKRIKINKAESIYLPEDDNDFQEDSSFAIKSEPSSSSILAPPTSEQTELYARTIASQLNELQSKQRFIAEKLISEVIFYGRLEKLRTGSSLNLDDDRV